MNADNNLENVYLYLFFKNIDEYRTNNCLVLSILDKVLQFISVDFLY